MPSGNDRTVGRTSVRSVENTLVERPTERALTSRTRRRVARKIRTEEVWTSTVTCCRSGRRDAPRRVGGRGTQLRTAGVYCTFLGFSSGPLFPRFPLPCCVQVSPGGGTTRRSGSVIGQYLNDIGDLSVVVGFFATKRYDETRPLSVSCTRAHVTFPHAQDRVSCTQRYLGLLWQYVAFRQQCSVGGHDRLCTVRERGRIAQTTVCVVRFWFLVKRNSCYPDNDASNDPLGMSEH